MSVPNEAISFNSRRSLARVWLALPFAGLLAAVACAEDDQGNADGDGAAGSPGQSGAPASDQGGDGGSGLTGQGGLAGDPAAGGRGETAGAGGVDTDKNVSRPEELPFEQEKLEQLTLPAGFVINVYRSGLGQARMLGIHGEHVYVTQPMEGNVLRLVDDDQDGVAESEEVVASGLPMIHGIAFHEDFVYLADVKHVYRATVAADGSFAAAPVALLDDLPDGGQHPLRTLGIGPDALLYISVGSDCDACVETNPEHATILRSPLAGAPAAGRTIFAKGLRNTIGFGWHPVTEALWGMDHGSDFRGDDLPPEELNAIEIDGDYGWPYCYADRQPDPIIQDPPDETKAEYCAKTLPPVLLNQAHEAPIGLAFYQGGSFPERYINGAFIALHGSWNRDPATGYEVAFIPFVDGEPQAIEPFVTGFLASDAKSTFGRPAGINVAADGSLLFTDDSNGIVYRVQYE
ncbi:MAG TPA: PQQ-dependent sugar dehydrogenase [Polyangiaceae bacterium]|nr:PQQ-dependent sugar dehydrogenase [Polyangiaceae bacterium]